MTTLQQYLNQLYPTKEEKKELKAINILSLARERKKQGFFELLEGGELNLSEYEKIEDIVICGSNWLKTPLTKLVLEKKPNLKSLNCDVNWINNLDLSGCSVLQSLDCSNNNLTSIEFLNNLISPEKLVRLTLYNNKIQSTNIDVFSRFENLKKLKIGTVALWLKDSKHNHFFGSFKSWKGLNKLTDICIEATDVDEGLEYLPFSLAEATAQRIKEDRSYFNIECSPHDTDARCETIQNELRKYNYDLQSWQLAHPHLMYKSRPEIFFNTDTKTKWLSALRDKINQSESNLKTTKNNNPKAFKKIKRLETKLHLLKTTQDNISSHSLIDKLQSKEIVEKKDKATQTDLIAKTTQELIVKKPSWTK